MELGPQNHNREGLLGPNSIVVVYMDPLGKGSRFTQRLLSSSFLGLPYRLLNIYQKKELLRGLWVGLRVEGLQFRLRGFWGF